MRLPDSDSFASQINTSFTMKTFSFVLFLLKHGSLAAALLWISTPLMVSAQHDEPMAVDQAMTDSLHHRMERRMAHMQERMQAMQEYLQQSENDLRWIDPSEIAPNMQDEAWFDDFEEAIPDWNDLAQRPPQFFPPDGFDFENFEPFGEPDNWNSFFLSPPGSGGHWISLEACDTIPGKDGKRFKTMVLRGKTNDTVVFEGDGSMVYSLADSNGYFVVRGDNLVGDTIDLRNGKNIYINGVRIYRDTAACDSSGNFYWTWNNPKPGRHAYHFFDRQRKHPKSHSRGNYYWSYTDQNRGARLADLTTDEISHLKNTDLKPTRRTIPLGIDNLKVTPSPSGQQLRIEFSSPGNDNLTVQLFDTDGNLIHDEHLKRHSGDYDNRIKIPNLHDQSLFIRISRGKQSLMKRIDL